MKMIINIIIYAISVIALVASPIVLFYIFKKVLPKRKKPLYFRGEPRLDDIKYLGKKIEKID